MLEDPNDPKRVGAPDSPPTRFNPISLDKLDKNLYLARKEHVS